MASNNPRNYKRLTIERLFALSGNKCAFPGCPQHIFENDKNISNICHIEAAEKGGPRYNPNSDNNYRRSFENLILLCVKHHKITDDIEVYTVEKLREMKNNHESNATSSDHIDNVISKRPSELTTVIRILGHKLFNTDKSQVLYTPPNIEEKILYNNVIKYKEIIDDYKIYQGTLDSIFIEIENDGNTWKDFLLQNIQYIYRKEKFKYNGIDEIKKHSDQIIQNVENELLNEIENSSNDTEELSFAQVRISLQVILVDAFMRCKILEEPPQK